MQLRIHLKMWRAGHRQSALKQESERRADEAMISGEAILTFLKEDRAQIDVFISEDGPVVVYEILQDPCSERVGASKLSCTTACQKVLTKGSACQCSKQLWLSTN